MFTTKLNQNQAMERQSSKVMFHMKTEMCIFFIDWDVILIEKLDKCGSLIDQQSESESEVLLCGGCWVLAAQAVEEGPTSKVQITNVQMSLSYQYFTALWNLRLAKYLVFAN